MTDKHNPDQWESDGDCSKCRRNLYCKKACSANRTSLQREIRRIIAEKAGLNDIKRSGYDE